MDSGYLYCSLEKLLRRAKELIGWGDGKWVGVGIAQ